MVWFTCNRCGQEVSRGFALCTSCLLWAAGVDDSLAALTELRDRALATMAPADELPHPERVRALEECVSLVRSIRKVR